MKNLFDYATKELSQDAFLRWLFENYDCENQAVKKTCEKIFRKITKDQIDFSDITDLTTKAQWKYIDVSVWFKYKGEKYLIVIEDKTYSNEHSQLKTYNDSIEQCAELFKGVYKLFYKTAQIDTAEHKSIDDAGWTVFDINDIYNLFYDISDTGSEILDGYAEHVKKTYKYFYKFEQLNFRNDWLWNNAVFQAYSTKKWGSGHTSCYNGIYVYSWINEKFKRFKIELLFEFRHWEIVAKIQYWKNENEKYDIQLLKDYLRGLTIYEPFTHKTHYGNKRLARIVKFPEDKDFFNSYEEFDKWINECGQSYNKILAQIDDKILDEQLNFNQNNK